MSYAELKRARVNGGDGDLIAAQVADMEKWPLLCSGLTDLLSFDETKSVLSLQIFFRGGKPNVRIEDREERVQVFGSANSLADIIQVAEDTIADPAAVWVPVRRST